jgi:hypothetical protein
LIQEEIKLWKVSYPIRFKEHKHSIIQDSNRDFTLYISGALQLAIDEKIYRAGYLASDYGSNRLSVINNPELDGTNCNYIQNAIDLKTGIVKQGLPPFITSLFLYTFQYEFNCLEIPLISMSTQLKKLIL